MKSPKILLVEDDEAALFGYTRYLSKSGYRITSADCLKNAKKSIESELFDAVLLDLDLPDGNGIDWIMELRTGFENIAIIVITGNSEISTAVKAMQLGADNFMIKPVNMNDLDIYLRKCLDIEELRKKNAIYKRLSFNKKEPWFGASKPVEKAMELATVAAASDTVALLTGETGTGKGVLARWIHDHSERKSEAFVELNCSTLRGDLLRSELFGHAKGSFTSALNEKQGLIEVADCGTLFLDEIGDMDLAVQSQLLKTIEEKNFRRIGENKLRTSEFRLICATNHDLEKATKNNTFRSDLYYRICVFPILLSPLRECKEDLRGLSEYILASFNYQHLPLPDSILTMFKNYFWPGNIRELRNMLERGLLLAQGTPLDILNFPGLYSESSGQKDPPPNTWSLDHIEKIHILKALKHFNNDKYKTSDELGISLSSLYRKLERIDQS